MSTDAPRIVIVGAGVAGLAAARRVCRAGFRAVLIDKGERIGGRTCTRTVPVPGRGTASFDHGAQCWRVYENAARQSPSHRPEDLTSLLADATFQVRPWELRGGDLARACGGNTFAVAGGMRELALRLAPKASDGVDVRLKTTVLALEPVDSRWKVRTDNGETVTADGLVLTAPLPQALALLDRRDVVFPAAEWEQLRKVEYTRCLAVLLVVEGASKRPENAAFDSAVVEYVAENQDKGVSAVGPALTVLTRHAFAVANWDAPDADVVAAVVAALPPWVSRVVTASQVKRWRFSQVVAPFPEPFALLRDPPLVIAGDGFAAGGFASGINRAFASGSLAAGKLIRFFGAARRRARPPRPILEVAVTTPDEARTAVSAGADRLELCADLGCGGVTPSLGMFRAVRDAVGVPVYVMLRPRPGGFSYTTDELDVMTRDAKVFLDEGADGLVFGILTATGRVSEAACAPLVRLADGRAVFHRAFDFIRDQKAALRTLIGLGFERVQTSGKKATAAEGAEQIATLVTAAGWDIEVLPAGGVGPGNVAALLADTGCDQVHGSFRGSVADRCLAGNAKLLAAMGATADGWTPTTDPGLVTATRQAMDRAAEGDTT
jgi:copper homeostasis protein CutC/predicted NAD/FAD-dependent oxidoreductase